MKRSDFDTFSHSLGINDIAKENVYKKFHSGLNKLLDFIETSFLEKETKKRYKILITERMQRLFN